MFVPQTARERMLVETLRLATSMQYNRGNANYRVLNWTHEIASGMTRDEAIGYARGAAAHASGERGGVWFRVACGTFIVWPEEQWGDEVSTSEGKQ